MVWAKRRFAFADYSPYFDRFEMLVNSNEPLCRQFITVSTDGKKADGDGPGMSNVYIGVPSEIFLVGFDGFERVVEADLPKIIDNLLIADASTEEFKSRFRFRTDDERRRGR